MSVHSEYGRALETLITRLSDCRDVDDRKWSSSFEQARIAQNSDLSSAARRCLELLGRFDQAKPLPALTHGVQESCDHLRSHCRAILGIPAADPD